MAPEYFQKINFENFSNIEGVTIYFDDLLIAETEEAHDMIVKKVMGRARKMGIKFNRNKIQYKVKAVKYLGIFLVPKG